MRPYAKLYLTKKGERAAKTGHPWVYGEEVTRVDGTYKTGDIVDVYSDKDRYLGTGFANDISKIRVRIVSRNANDRFDDAFWQRRVKYALDYRRTVMGETDFACCRLISAMPMKCRALPLTATPTSSWPRPYATAWTR